MYKSYQSPLDIQTLQNGLPNNRNQGAPILTRVSHMKKPDSQSVKKLARSRNWASWSCRMPDALMASKAL